MEMSFPQGNLDKPLSNELRSELYNTMKPVVWAIKLSDNTFATGFCIDPTGLLFTAAHVLSQGNPILARRAKDKAFLECECVYKVDNFDVALLRVCVEKSGSSSGFDFVAIDREFSRKIPLGMDVYSIGLSRGPGFHFTRGQFTYEFDDDNPLYSFYSLAKENDEKQKKIHEMKLEETTFMNDALHGVYKSSFVDFGMHPELKYLQIQFGAQNAKGLAGAPIFDSKGRVIGMVQRQHVATNGLSSGGLEVVVKLYKDEMGG